MKKELISLIIPCFNEEEMIPIFYKELDKVSKKMNTDFEFIFIDDGSFDKTLSEIKDLRKKDKRVKFISFSKNFGKEAGMLAGLNKSIGDYVAIMDVDLQDPPSELINMYKVLTEEDYDVAAIYSTGHEDYSLLRKIGTKIWYKLISKLTGNSEKPGTRDYRLMKRKVVDAILSLPEKNRYTRGLYSYVGYKIKWIPLKTPDRKDGTSKFTLKVLLKYAIEGIVTTTTKPLLIPLYLGLLLSLISFISLIVLIIDLIIKTTYLIPLIVFLTTLVLSLQFIFIGIIGLYISKIHNETKNRPLYIIGEESE